MGASISFQEYFVKFHHDVVISHIDLSAAQEATLTDQARSALAAASRVVIAPSNPLISIGPLLAIPGVSELLQAKRNQVVCVSPIVGGNALKGPADRLMRELGFEASAFGVATLYQDLASSIVIDHTDADLAGAIEALGMTCIVTDTIMDGGPISRALAEAVLNA
jgi:LPPG:FO 2-phospho-L-lactate transferase